MKAPTTARAAYGLHREQVAARLKQLKAALRDHNARAAKQPLDWGYAGSLGHVSEVLGEVLAFLGVTPAEGGGA